MRELNFTLFKNKIEPSVLQQAGLQGEHNATTVYFHFDEDFFAELQTLAQNENTSLKYRIDTVDSTGRETQGVPADFPSEPLITVPVTDEMTVNGGNLSMYVSITEFSEEETFTDLYSYPAYLYFEYVPEGLRKGASVPSMTQLAEAAKNSSIEGAQINEQGHLIVTYYGGRTVDIGFVLGGPMGPTGPAGIYYGTEPPTDESHPLWINPEGGGTTIDTVFNPESLNPQSGTAMAGALKDYISSGEDEPDENVTSKYYIQEMPIGDEISEIGTSGNWRYRKYINGDYVCWGKFVTTLDITTSWGNLYTTTPNGFTAGFPISFVEPPHVHCSAHGGGALFCYNEIEQTTEETGEWRAARGEALENVEITFDFYVIGRWK